MYGSLPLDERITATVMC